MNFKLRNIFSGSGGAVAAATLALLALSSAPAKADVFGGANKGASPELESRLSSLEQQLQRLLNNQGSKASTSAADASEGKESSAEPARKVHTLERAEDYELGYVYLGRVNGKHLIRLNGVRLLLSDAEKAQFDKDEARRSVAAGNVPPAPGGNSLELTLPPPPTTAPPPAKLPEKPEASVKSAKSTVTLKPATKPADK